MPQLVSEYGSGFKLDNFSYTAQHDWFVLRGVTSKLHQFLKRPDRLLKTIPFIVDKATWYPSTGDYFYAWTLWHLIDGLWVETHLGKFYSQWKAVEGDRVKALTGNENVQANAFLDAESVVHVCLNNLLNQTTQISLSLFDLGAARFSPAFFQANSSRLFFNYSSLQPQLELASLQIPASMPFNFTLRPEESAIFSVLLSSPPAVAQFDSPPPSTLTETTLYGSPLLLPVTPGNLQNFSFSTFPSSIEPDYAFVRVF